MKKLFRDRKTSIDSKPRPVVSIPAPLGGADTPLYARFATVTRGQDGGSPTKPVVSGPMQLSSRASFSRGQSNGAAAAPVGVKSRGGERQAHGTGPILGRSSQDAVKPQKLHRMPSKAGQEMASPPSINRMAQMEQRPQVIASPPLNQSSRPLPASPIRDEPWGAYPHIQSPVPPTNGYYGQNPPASRLERMPTESASSLTSDSFSYSPPHRQLVVRNFDPDNDSLPDAVVRPTPATGYSYPQAPLSPPVLPKPLDISSPLLRPSHLHQSGFDLQPPPLSHTATKEHRYPGPSRAAHIPVHDHKPSVSNIPLNNGIASSSIPQHPPQPTLHNTRTAPLHTPALDQHDSHESRPQPPPNRQASLLATPSVRRKKYSPLAAFGLPATQTGSTPSLAASTSSASGHDDVVPSDDNKNSSPLPAPESHDVPLLPPLDVSSSSFQLPLLDIDLGDWRKTATERASRRASRADSPAKRISKIPSIPPSPASPPQSQLPEIDEQGFLREQILDDATVTASRPQGLTYTAPIPIHPPTQPGALTSQLSTSLQSTSSTSHSPAPPSETISVASRGEMPDVGDTRFQNTGERSPALPVKSHQGLSRSYEDNEETRAPTQYQQQPERKTPPSEQQNSTMRRGPLIFAAMEATEMSEVHNIYVEPEMVGFIGGVSAAAKAEEAYTFGPHASYQTPNSTPPPPPEKEEKIHSRKLSKPKREHSSRKTDVAKEDVVQNHSHSRHGSSRTVVYNSVAEGSSVQHRSAPAPTNQPGPSSRTREETERQSSDVERHARRPSVSSENKLKRRSRDGVKALTEKQMEKLSNRKSYTDVPQRPSEPQASSSRRPTPVEQTTAYPPPPHKLSYKSTAPFIPTQPAEPSTIPPPHHAKRTHHAGQLSLSTENGSRHASPQLPTPPEEYTPSAPKKPRRQKKSASPPATRDQHAALSPEIKREPQSYPLVVHLAHTVLLEELLSYLTYFEWLTLASVSKEVRRTLFEDGRESVLERYLRTVGYTRWIWDTPEPLKLRVEVR
ncbi:hypothetical protein BDW22DRAFT_1212341 [Trametopsis cervina]|nr:hypothetical protein BDW22DRAFT_1212341 [Trametopsis cervina]